MRPYTGYYEDPEGFEDFAYGRSQALNKLLRAHRREERIRHENHYREYTKTRKHRENWDWDDDDDDYDSFVDDNFGQYSENRDDSY